MAKRKHNCPFLNSKKRKRTKKSAKPITKRAKQQVRNMILSNGNVLGSVASPKPPPAKRGRKSKKSIAEASKENASPNDERSMDSPASGSSQPAMPVLVKMEPESREASPMQEAGDRPSDAVDGRVKGHALGKKERYRLEENSRIHYPFPRFTHFSGRNYFSKTKMLDLMLDDEIDEGEREDNKDYTIDCILAVDEFACLVVWEGYKFATWELKERVSKRGAAMYAYNQRDKIIQSIYRRLATTEPLSVIKAKYPNITLNQTLDYEEYVKHPGILYLSGLHKRERQINDFFNEKHGRSADATMILFVDWTNFSSSYIPSFEYLVDNELTPASAAIEADLMADQRSCSTCVRKCDGESGCCETKAESDVAFLSKGQLGNLRVKKHDHDDDVFEMSPDYVDVYECGDACNCDKQLCIQRGMQKGHNNTLVAFMHHEKGWTMYSGNDLKRGQFVCEYVGVVSTLKEAANTDSTYQIELEVKSSAGKSKTFVIDSQHKGNESRFFSHSCEPNLFSYRIHYDIAGRPKRHIGLFAGCDIPAGTELTFDYYTGYQDPEEFHEQTKFACKCGSTKCREKAYQLLQKKKKQPVVKIED